MCGIAGYSLRPGSRVERTLAAQALLAAIAERGADAVGLRLPRPRPTPTRPSSSSARRPRSSSSASRCPTTANQLLVHVRDYTKGHPSIAANNHPVRHGPVVGIHNGIIVNDDELLAPHSCARAEPRMTVDSEAIFAVAAHSRQRRARTRAPARRDGDAPGSTSASRASSSSPAASAGRCGSARAATASSSPRRSSRSRSSSATAGCTLRKREVREGTLLALARRRDRHARERFRPDLDYVEARPAAVGARAARARVLPDAARRARRRRVAGVSARPSRPRATVDAVLEQRARGQELERRPRAAARLEHAVDLPLGQHRRVARAGRPASRRTSAAGRAAVRAPRPARSRARAAPPPPPRRSPPRAAPSRASRTCASRATSTASSRGVRLMSSAVGVRPSSSPSSRSWSTSSSRVAKRRGIRPAARLAAFQVPKCSITVCGCTCASGSAANSFIVGERPSRSADARSSSRICSSV